MKTTKPIKLLFTRPSKKKVPKCTCILVKQRNKGFSFEEIYYFAGWLTEKEIKTLPLLEGKTGLITYLNVEVRDIEAKNLQFNFKTKKEIKNYNWNNPYKE